MAMIATAQDDPKAWNYLLGDYHHGLSIAVSRYYHLFALANMAHDAGQEFKIALKDPHTGAWTKWKPFYGGSYRDPGFSFEELQQAYDIHRSVLENEIVIESDILCKECQRITNDNKARAQVGLEELPKVKGCADCYAANWDAARIIGAIIESKGFTPHYYYSGSKSIHIHIFIDFRCLLKADPLLQEKVLERFKYRTSFVKAFMGWLRELMISCWHMQVRQFDEQLVRATHLIRCEMSKNKAGYKTFIGYTYKDLSFVPYLCNEENRIYPRIATLFGSGSSPAAEAGIEHPVKLSSPTGVSELLEEFLGDLDKAERKGRNKRKEQTLAAWLNPELVQHGGVRECIKFMLSDEFKKAGDGYQRAMFFIANELKDGMSEDQQVATLKEWNARMGSPIRDQELEYRVLHVKHYSTSCSMIHAFLGTLGFSSVGEKCKQKIYKPIEKETREAQ